MLLPQLCLTGYLKPRLERWSKRKGTDVICNLENQIADLPSPSVNSTAAAEKLVFC